MYHISVTSGDIFTGGFIFNNNQKFNEELISYKKRYENYLNFTIKDLEKKISSNIDNNTREALISSLKSFIERKAIYDKKGPLIYGIEIFSTAKELSEFNENNNLINIIEKGEQKPLNPYKR